MLRKLGIVGLGVPLVAIIAALIYLFLFGETEPTFEDATQQLAQDHTVYGLDLEGRPAALVAPFGADPAEPLPLIIALHGYGSNVWEHSLYLGLIGRISADRFLLLMPNGSRDEDGNRFWNATEFCCDYYGSAVDDVAYISELVEEATRHVEISGVYVVGYGNGAFMAYRLACDSLTALIGIVAIAGSSFADDTRCDEAVPVSTLHIHGFGDDVFRYYGGEDGEYPYAAEVSFRWARRAGCDFTAPEVRPSIDLVPDTAGDETRVFRYAEGCSNNVVIEHWGIAEAGHTPQFAKEVLGAEILDWLLKNGSQH